MKRVFTLGDVRIESSAIETTLDVSTGNLSLSDENQASISLSELHVMDDGGTYVKPAIDGRKLAAYNSGGTENCYISHDGTNGWARCSAGKLKLSGAKLVESTKPLLLESSTVSLLPSASPAGQLLYCSDASGGAVPVFSDGTNWRRVTDRVIVS